MSQRPITPSHPAGMPGGPMPNGAYGAPPKGPTPPEPGPMRGGATHLDAEAESVVDAVILSRRARRGRRMFGLPRMPRLAGWCARGLRGMARVRGVPPGMGGGRLARSLRPKMAAKAGA